jgi:ketosteroid isomerase-like protein
MSATDGNTELRTWLDKFQECVRALDYTSARNMVAADVMAFGTYAAVVVGVDALVRDQWSKIWPTIQDFTFRTEELFLDVEADIAWLACPWDSKGRSPDGQTFDRPGRMTAGLRRLPDGRWVATHTHHSVYPRPAV